MNIAVLKGGISSEREVSLRTGAGVAEALRTLGHVVEEVDVQSEKFEIPAKSELAFICLHGTFGEDGRVQAILEKKGVPYTGEGVEVSRLAMEKLESKSRFRAAGVPTPDGGLWDGKTKRTFPFILKPVADGSSVGLHRVFNDTDFQAALADASGRMMIEEMITGRELTVGILGHEALPVIEIRPHSGVYDYFSKYTSGQTEYICPARISSETTRRVQEAAAAAHKSIGGRVYSRVDLMLDANENAWVLEINTIPGMTALSLLPKAAAAAGISYPQLCERIIHLSLEARG